MFRLFVYALLLSVSLVAQGRDGLRARIPPELTFTDVLDHFLAYGDVSTDRAVEIAIANDKLAWDEFHTKLGDSFSSQEYMRDYRLRVAKRLSHVDERQRFRASGALRVVRVQVRAGRVFVQPPGRLDTFVPNIAATGYKNVTPALLITHASLDFPPRGGWWVQTDPSLARRIDDRIGTGHLSLDVSYDFDITRCQLVMTRHALRCSLDFVRVWSRAAAIFDQSDADDRLLLHGLEGPVRGVKTPDR